MDTRRRQFLRAEFLTRKGREAAAGQQRAQGPAPPWHRTHLEQTLCSSCEGHCAAACEADIVRVHDSAHRLAGMPYLEFEAGGCTFCRACVEVCPMDLEIRNDHPQPRIGIAALENSRCLAWNGVICMSCLYACPYQAIDRDPRGRASIVAEACLGCGMCISVCPQRAITLHW